MASTLMHVSCRTGKGTWDPWPHTSGNRIYLRAMPFEHRSFALFILLLSASPAFAQKEREASATFSLVLPRTVTMEMLEARCIEQARLKAIGDAFGYTVSEMTLSRILDTRDRFEDNFSVLTRTSVEGEWLGDMRPPTVSWACVQEELTVTATVHGRIRAFGEKARAQVAFHPSGTSSSRPQEEFRHGDGLHAHFRVSHAGHLAVFFVDHAAGRVYRVFPAAAYSALDHLPVQADRPYVLFDPAQARQFPDHPAVTPLVLEVPDGKPQVVDELVAVYSPKPFSKPLLSLPQSPQDLPAMEQEAFETWLIELRKRNAEAVVKRTHVMVLR